MDTHPTTAPAISSGLKQPYHLVDPSPWPLVAALGAGLTVFGIVHAAHFGTYSFLVLGLLVLLSTMALWWRDVLKESATPGLHGPVVRLGLRYGMTLFITSEVMFFVGFFWAFFHFALFPEHVLDQAGPAIWPPAGIFTFDPFKLPLMNTMILLLSGCTVTWAHHALIENNRRDLLIGIGHHHPARHVVHVLPVCRVFGGAVRLLRRRRLSGRVLPGDGLPWLPRDHSARSSSGSAGFARRMGSSPPPGISGLRRQPGIGTSSTWCGCSCSSASMCGARASR